MVTANNLRYRKTNINKTTNHRANLMENLKKKQEEIRIKKGEEKIEETNSVEKNGIEKEGISQDNVAAYKTDKQITYPLTQYNAEAIKRWKELKKMSSSTVKKSSGQTNTLPTLVTFEDIIPYTAGATGKIIWRGKNKFISKKAVLYDTCQVEQDATHQNSVEFNIVDKFGKPDTPPKKTLFCTKSKEQIVNEQENEAAKKFLPTRGGSKPTRGRNRTHRKKRQSRCLRGYK